MIQVQSETSWKIWAGVGLLGAVLVYLATFSAGRLVQPTSTNESVSYNYEMPRVENAEVPFDLSNRAVERQTLGAAENQSPAAEAPVVPHVVPVKAGKTALVNGKNKKLTPAQMAAAKSKQIAEAAKKAQLAKQKAQTAARQKAVTEARRRRFEMQILAERQRARLQAEAEAISAQDSITIATGVGYETTATETTPTDSEKNEDESLSSAQWRTLLQKSPTAANVAKLAAAFGAKKIDANTFYQITKELLMDSATDRQKAGLMLISMTPSLGTYEFMVTQMNEMKPEVQTYLKKEVSKYSEPSKLGITSQVISSSKEPAVVASAMGNLTTALENYKKQPASGTISSQGGAKTPGITAASLTQFLSSLERLSQSEDAAIAAQAKSLSQSIGQIKK